MKHCKDCNLYMCGLQGSDNTSNICGTAKKLPCTHSNKAYGPITSGMREWVCRDCGQQGEEPDEKYCKDYYKTLLRHLQAGTLKGKEEAK